MSTPFNKKSMLPCDEPNKLGPLKTSMSQPLRNANFMGPEGCDIEVFNGSVFLLFLIAKSGVKRFSLPYYSTAGSNFMTPLSVWSMM